ncbi:hypothetical protein HDU96_005122 [Phlyctochytrium bullatum]|nr:hypothetical protein HDU96_005122 [Phlyctochytrium bullatum]
MHIVRPPEHNADTPRCQHRAGSFLAVPSNFIGWVQAPFRQCVFNVAFARCQLEMDMDQLASMPAGQLELVLELLKESRLLTEAETRKHEEIRRIKELELAVAAVQPTHPALKGGLQNSLPSNPDGLDRGMAGLMATSIEVPGSSPTVADDLLRMIDGAGKNMSRFGPIQALSESPPAAILTPQSAISRLAPVDGLSQSPDYAAMLASLANADPFHTLHALESSSTPLQPFGSFASVNSTHASSSLIQAMNLDFRLEEQASSDRTAISATPPPLVHSNFAATLAAITLPSPGTPMISLSQVDGVDEGRDGRQGAKQMPFAKHDSALKIAEAAERSPSRSPPQRSSASPTPLTQRWTPPPPDAPATGELLDPFADDDLPSLNLSRASVRRRIRCHRCRHGVCVFIFYGSTKLTVPPTAEDLAAAEDRVLCPACFAEREGTFAAGAVSCFTEDRAGAEEVGLPTKMRKRRVKKVTQSTPLKCDACSREIGWGGMRMVDAGMAMEREGEWTEPPFGVEAVCDDCVKNFDFCTQCGGGGTFRTGKWRPRQLFLPRRRNCTLPHTRYGILSDIQCITFRCAPDGIPDSSFDPQPEFEKRNDRAMNALRAQFQGRFPASRELLELKMADAVELYRVNKTVNHATALVMAHLPLLGTWRRSAERMETGVKEIEALVFGDDGTIGDAPPPGEVRRYLCTVDALRSFRKVGRKKSGQTAEIPEPEPELCPVGFLIFQWHIPRRQILFSHGTIVQRESEVDDPLSQVSLCLASILSRIQREARTEKLPMPLHCGVWIYRAERQVGLGGGAFAIKMKAMGMLPMAEYCAKLDEREREVFADGVNVFGVGKGIKQDMEHLFIGMEEIRRPWEKAEAGGGVR